MFASENSPANKNMFKVDGKKNTLELFQLMLFGSNLITLKHVFTSALEPVFNKASSFYSKWQWQSLFLRSGCLVKLQAFNINGRDGVCDRTFFYPSAVTESVFSKASGFYYNLRLW